MKPFYAVISVTNQGSVLAAKIAAQLPGETKVYAREGRNLALEAEEYTDLSQLVQSLFPHVSGLICVMAAGIAVRTIAPLLVHKSQDPALVVLDEKGEFAISLVSGHLGGANELARTVASITGGMPVITTATDVQQVMAPDIFAIHLGLDIESFEDAKDVAALIVNGKKVLYFIDETIPEAEFYRKKAQEHQINLLPMNAMGQLDHYDGAIVITDHHILQSVPTLYLRPPALVAGIGCRRGTPGAEILQALQEIIASQGRSIRSLTGIASVTIKEDEIGIHSVAEQLGVKTLFYTPEELAKVVEQENLSESNFVKEKIGVGNVCEPAAILASQGGKIIAPKKSFGGITIALARVKSM